MHSQVTVRVSTSVIGWSETPLGTLRPTMFNVTSFIDVEIARLADSIFTGFVLATHTLRAVAIQEYLRFDADKFFWGCTTRIMRYRSYRTLFLAFSIGVALLEDSSALSISFPKATFRILQISVLTPPGRCTLSLTKVRMFLSPSFIPSVLTKLHGNPKFSKHVSERKDRTKSQTSQRILVSANAQGGSLAVGFYSWSSTIGAGPSILTAILTILFVSWLARRGLGLLVFFKDWLIVLGQLCTIQLRYVTESLSVQKEVFFLLTLEMTRRMQHLQNIHDAKLSAKDKTKSLTGVLPHVDTLMWRRKSPSSNLKMKEGSPLLKELVLVGGGHAHAYVLKNLGMNPIPSVGSQFFDSL